MGYETKRRWPRRSVVIDCAIEGVSSRASVRLTDLSVGGGYVDANTMLSAGDPVKLVMTVDDVEIAVGARVLYTFGAMGFGFAFDLDNMPAETRQRIAEFVSRGDAVA
jgi:hypothetical protein